MQLNKTNRAKSAVLLRTASSPRVKASPIAHRKTEDNQYENFSIIQLKNQSPQLSQRKDSKQTQFRLTLQRLSHSPSKKSFLAKSRFLQYNSQSWRTIHSARSMPRLQSLSDIQSKNPIKINLQQKVQRIRSKHNELQSQFLMQKIQSPQKPQKSLKNQSSQVAHKINQILIKWQKQKTHSVEVYKKKIQVLAQKFANKLPSKNEKQISEIIKWQIC